MEKPRIVQSIIVEGKYDKNALRQVVDAHIIQTNGFGVFSDKELLTLIKRLADIRGVIIMTDGDGAGFVIRNYLKGALPKDKVINAYIPDIKGKEKRKTQLSGEGKLGVEGMTPDIILKTLRDAGATFEGDSPQGASNKSREITKTDLYLAGLTGGADSAWKRRELIKKLELPEHMSANAFLQALNVLFTYEEFKHFLLLNPQDRQSR